MRRCFWLVLAATMLLAYAPSRAYCQLSPSDTLTYHITFDADDGTETNHAYWSSSGCAGTNLNRMGHTGIQSYDTALLFLLPDVAQGETFVYARLALPGTDYGFVESEVNLRVVGINHDGCGGFSRTRPSAWPKTTASASWLVDQNWPAESGTRPTPLWRHTPDLAPIINAIVGRPGWGRTAAGKALALVIEGDATSGDNFLAIKDYDLTTLYDLVAPTLELFRTVRSTFLAPELLGRPTAHSITINALSLLTLDAYVEYGPRPDRLSSRTPVTQYPGQIPMEITLNGLTSDTTYYYRLSYRPPGAAEFEAGPLGRFHTQRPPGSSFQFAVQTDSHIWETVRQGTNAALYAETLGYLVQDQPEFLMDLGDTFFCEDYNSGDVLDLEDAMLRVQVQRPFLRDLCRSTPLFLVLGNHEGEQGWRLDGTPDNVAVWATNARKALFPNPVPDDFYTGNQDDLPFVGQRADYYAFEWGDALFVALDPFWYTARSPHSGGGFPGSGNNWDWTLGYTQYTWLRDVLRSSTARFKFIFLHQLVGGRDVYGRGGIEAVKHCLGGWGSFEWGGEDPSGAYAFNRRRPGWGMPIHRLLVENGVTIVFHGHDHVFVKQPLDGVVYQECPQPSDSMYSGGLFRYVYGDRVDNTGYLLVSVGPTRVRVEYIRVYLPGEGPSGELAYSYEIDADPD